MRSLTAAYLRVRAGSYFRSLLAATYERGLDSLLERALAFLVETQGVPVRLSMLVLVFKTSDAGSMPTNLYRSQTLIGSHRLISSCSHR